MKNSKKTTKKTTKPVVKPKEKEENNDDFYTKEEIKELDKYHEFTGHKFEDEEIYEIMGKYKNDEKLVLEELNNILNDREKRGESDWGEVKKGKI